MFGAPDPIIPDRNPKNPTGQPKPQYGRTGFVSIWVGTFPSIESAEEYFGIPDEIGVYLPPEAFASELGLGDFPPDILEVNFEQVEPRPVEELLESVSFAESFMVKAIAAAQEAGISEAQGVALLFDFDYRLKPDWKQVAGPLRFVGTFPYVRFSAQANLESFRELADQIGYPVEALLFVCVTLSGLSKTRREEQREKVGPFSAKEYCDYLLTCSGESSTAILREFGLGTSEHVGRVVSELIAAKTVRWPGVREVDFEGLFALE
jgi:hypothetical protein